MVGLSNLTPQGRASVGRGRVGQKIEIQIDFLFSFVHHLDSSGIGQVPDGGYLQLPLFEDGLGSGHVLLLQDHQHALLTLRQQDLECLHALVRLRHFV